MKKVLIGGFFSIVGSIWALAIAFAVGNNMAFPWDSRIGRFWSTVIEMDLMFLMILSVLLVIAGLCLMVIELFKKEQ